MEGKLHSPSLKRVVLSPSTTRGYRKLWSLNDSPVKDSDKKLQHFSTTPSATSRSQETSWGTPVKLNHHLLSQWIHCSWLKLNIFRKQLSEPASSKVYFWSFAKIPWFYEWAPNLLGITMLNLRLRGISVQVSTLMEKVICSSAHTYLPMH